jgi:hypothetical protein
MSIKKLLIVAGALAVAACAQPTGNQVCAYNGHGDELDTSECVLQDAITETPQGVVVTEENQ